ncbi:hypothetical protein JOF41_007366 [Saccharothrix coeruleofusca]|uniref:hypothetical protein n=1 Tax=Saccharothrix coeruleofusca TaxID=33919 RepID=UPI001AE2CEE4|nr:hypothetical protein [Saccharothrix coeruleofusca]MBP2341112.1 hypothetical protein [Saccharothrix coeruleofusca]
MANSRPANLGAKARAVWDDITGSFDLRADERRVLEDCCREIDLIERLEAELRGADLVVQGSMGQPVSSPLVTEIRQHRSTLARLFAALKLPEDAGSADQAAQDRSSSARKAAQARWGTGKRRGA